MTLQLPEPEPAQVVEARTGDPIHVVLQCEFAVEQNPKVMDNIARLNVHRVDRESAFSPKPRSRDTAHAQ